MKLRTLVVLLLAGIWGVGSWWWYTCKVKGFCSAGAGQTVVSASATAASSAVAATSTEPAAAEPKTPTPDTSGDTTDSDNDGLPNELERKLGLDPYVSDTDKDGIRDELEIGNNTDTPLDTDDDGTINALDGDDDGDGDPTANEAPDANHDGDPKDARDSDEDKIPDYLDKDSGWATMDDDGDGVNNGEEKKLGTNPTLTDSDGDGVPDSIELVDAQDTDGDSIIDALDTDDDGDGIMTAMENPDPNGDGNTADAADNNGNGLPDYMDADMSGETTAQAEPTDDGQDMATGKATTPDNAAVSNNAADTANPTPPADTASPVQTEASKLADTTPVMGEIASTASASPTENTTDKPATDLASNTENTATAPTTAATADNVAVTNPTEKPATTEQPSTDTQLADGNTATTLPASSDSKPAGDVDKTAAPEDGKPTDTAETDDEDPPLEATATEATTPATADENKLTVDTGGRKADGKGIRPAKLYFPFRSSEPELADSAAAYFDEVIAYLKANPSAKITLTGHTDSVGKSESNKDLGLQRAREIRDLLVKRGAPKKQIETDSKGEEEPLTSNRTDAGRKQNRRVELNPIK